MFILDHVMFTCKMSQPSCISFAVSNFGNYLQLSKKSKNGSFSFILFFTDTNIVGNSKDRFSCDSAQIMRCSFDNLSPKLLIFTYYKT